MTVTDCDVNELWARHSAEWRDAAQIVSHWRDASTVDPRLLQAKASRHWWDLLDELGVTLFVTREYEHLVMALSVNDGRPAVSFLPLPHPSGLVVDRHNNTMYLASTRNPNQVYTLKPAAGLLKRTDVKTTIHFSACFMPVASAFYPGSLYIHDLALFGDQLHANAVGHNAVVRLEPDGRFKRIWWPKCVERFGRPIFSSNHIQLNSIAAADSPHNSFYSASSSCIGRFRPGHLRYPVDQRGVIFSGRTREPVCTRLTRPHSARLRGDAVWVANSGYGELGFVRSGKLEVVIRLPGWTRGLCFFNHIAFIATSRVIPRFARYAPGLNPDRSRCSVYAVCCKTGKALGSLEWTHGNQVFAIDWIDRARSPGFVFGVRARRASQESAVFYRWLIDSTLTE